MSWSSSLTCDFASSTSILAAGCVTVILFRIVAPSLVMITSPSAWHTCECNKVENACMQSCAAFDQSTYHLVHPARTETCSDRISYSFCSFDVVDSDILLLGVLTAQRKLLRQLVFSEKLLRDFRRLVLVCVTLDLARASFYCHCCRRLQLKREYGLPLHWLGNKGKKAHSRDQAT